MSKQFVTVWVAVVVSVGLVFVGGCESDAGKGAGIGGLAGAGVGAIIGHQSGHTTEGALIGGGVGAGGGYIIGNERDKKKTEAEMDQLRAEMNNVTVTVTNSNGSKSQVLLRKQGVGYVGPRGEFYDHLPTDEELRPLYAF
ncbi:MAG TPA: glycine zipper domain-containing protein [Sedimentisphaerales bacterium]|nr:glycine zipper domain-containing protein [Sedimentisphaerales bacterium]